MASNPDNIPGVFNYCDRWCERCPLTHRCLNFQMERDAMGPDGVDPIVHDPKLVWKALHDNFKLTMDLLAEECEKRGIDMDEVRRRANTPEAIEAQRSADERRAEHPLMVAAEAYMHQTMAWLRSHAGALESGSASDENLADAVAIVRWYHTFVCAKLARAIGQIEDEEDAGDPDAMADANGSAKVALMGVDRSLAAWARVRAALPAEGDEIIDLLLELDRLRRRVERTFPHARAFVRPGFDDGTVPV
jgi:hypothetical protein